MSTKRTATEEPALQRTLSRVAYAKEFLFLASLLVVVVTSLVLLTYAGVEMLGSVRAFVQGEALYSKAQKDAVYHLTQYATYGRSEYYDKYQGAIAVPFGIRAARLELEAPNAQLSLIRAGLEQAKIDPSDMPNSVWGIRLFRNLQPMASAFRLWREADHLVVELDLLAQALYQQQTQTDPNQVYILQILQEIDRINLNLTNLEAAFSREVSESARWVQRVVAWSVLLGAVLLLVLSLGPLRVVLARLKGSQEKFRRIFEQSRDAIVLLMPDGSVSYANPAAHTLFGFTREDLESEDFSPFRAENIFANAQQRWEMLNAVQQHGFVEDLEATMCHRSGALIQCLLTATHIQDHHGETVGYETIIRDVTERKQTEARMRLLERSVEASGNAIFLSDATQPGYPLVYVNPAFERMTGFRALEAVGQPLRYFYRSDPEELALLQEALQQGSVTRMVLHSHRKNSIDFWSELSLAPVYNSEGAVVNYVGVQIDITESKQAEETLRQTLEKEKELSELRSRFVAMVSHEFRTPLATILSSAELVERFRYRWPEQRTLKHLRRIQASVQTMNNLLENVLALGKAESGRLPFAPQPTDLVMLCREISEEFGLAQGRQHHLAFIAPPALPEVELDPDLFRYALNNLLSNAFKYSPKDSQVTLEIAQKGEQVLVRVSDQGVGIPEEDLPYIFEPFHRAGNVDKVAGTGLGLSITRRVIEMHQGSISVASSPDGTTFTLLLPFTLEVTVPIEVS